MRQGERREYVRTEHHLPSKLFKLGLDSSAHGITVNVSPGGALIKTNDWRSFQVQDHVTITLFLPSSASVKDEMNPLRVAGMITRVDQEKEGVGVKFDEVLKLIGTIPEKHFSGE